MATTQIGSRTNPGPNKGGKGLNGGGADDTGLLNANFNSLAAKRARLTAINGAYYTAAFLNTLTENDMDYAIRLNDNPTSI